MITISLIKLVYIGLSTLFIQSGTSSQDLLIAKSFAASDNTYELTSVKSALLTDYLPRNFVTDASKDYTSYIQQAVTLNRNLIFPSFPLLINDKGITIPSNSTLTFLKGSELRLRPTSNPGYNILHIRGVSNVTLLNPVIKGDRYSHLVPQGGEWGMGIGIYGSNNISVLNPKILNCWGDGIYIGIENRQNCRNIYIKKAYIEYNRRNGISVIGVIGLKVEDSYIGFNNGTPPMSGIDIEPNGPHNEIKDVIFKNVQTREHPGAGIQIDLGNLMGGGQKKVDVTVVNHSDIKSNIGIKVMSRMSDGSSTIQGDLKFTNPRWTKNSLKAVGTILFGKEDVHLVIEDPIITDVNNRRLSKEETLTHMKGKRGINTKAWSNIIFTSKWPNLHPQNTKND